MDPINALWLALCLVFILIGWLLPEPMAAEQLDKLWDAEVKAMWRKSWDKYPELRHLKYFDPYRAEWEAEPPELYWSKVEKPQCTPPC